MARKKVEKQETDAQGKSLTRAQKTEATKVIIKALLAVKPLRHNELIEEVAKEYVHRHEGDATENINDVKGRVGSVLDIMKKDGEVGYDGGMYALKSRMVAPNPPETAEEKPVKKTARKKKEESKEEVKTEEVAPKKRGRPKKETAEETTKVEEKSAPKKKKAVKTKDKIVEPAKEPAEEKKDEENEPAPVPVSPPAPAPTPAPAPVPVPEKQEKGELVVAPKTEVAQKNVVMDMSFLFGSKPQKATVSPKAEPVIEKAAMPKVEKEEPKKEVEPKAIAAKTAPVAPKKAEGKPAPKAVTPKREVKTLRVVKATKPQTADEKLKESFLKRLRTLSGDYFEYYSIYLLERYSMKNGRRLEGLKISGGDHDGGIDGEIELTDKLGFRETIYIQSKNWDPEKGKEENWVVGETLLQQFIGACACRQAKDGKQHTRGIFMTTSRYTPDAKRILEDMSDKIVGYDGNDLYEAAKECEFGLIKKNGEWALDEKLLSGTKAFFQMY